MNSVLLLENLPSETRTEMRGAPPFLNCGNTLIFAVGIWGGPTVEQTPNTSATGATLNSAALRDFMDARGQWQVRVRHVTPVM